ncbi:MAG: hypothetical protein JO352_13895 [Chloroflexi bacterium]|nr:hypothetical protein [Chloroflexota bacterium]
MLPTDVYLEVGDKRVFACAFDWPGWCRSGRDEEAALNALGEYLPRYAVAAEHAKLRPPSKELQVVERLPGSATTDFGAPGAISDRDAERLTPAQARKLVALVEAAWNVFDDVVAGAPAQLRKGPRGGGRDRDKIVDHVYGAEVAYAGRLGLKLRQPARGDARAVAGFRKAVVEALENPVADARWPTRYAARRIAWHALDHAWEIEDRSE